jgi:hypothetical protein
MNPKYKSLLLFALLLIYSSAYAQFTLSGRIINQADTKPVSGVSVFINNSTIGITTANDGVFSLHNLMPGKYKLVISIIGFETADQDVTIGQNNIDLGDITIFPKSITLKEVKVTAKHDPDREEHYELFKDQFLGGSDIAKQCTILNPGILDIDYEASTGTLTASSEGFLEIENDALGYKVKYLLDKFTYINKNDTSQAIAFKGDVSFEPLKGSPSQQRRRELKRQEVYANSASHFFKSALAGQIDEEGFRVLKIAEYPNPERPLDSLITKKIKFFGAQKSRYPYWRDSLSYWIKRSQLPLLVHKLIPQSLGTVDLITSTDQPELFKFGGPNEEYYVTYNINHRFSNPPRVSHDLSDRYNTENTLIAFNSSFALISANGTAVNPFDMTFDGVWARSRVAELLPVDYTDGSLKALKISFSKSDSATIYRNLKSLENYSNANPIEKIHLHLDRQLYLPGDTIWFKAYVVLGEYHKLSALSGVMYAELISPKDSVLTRLTLKLDSGSSPGDFDLPINVEPGTYRIRAYTNYMRNAGSDYFYDQQITVAGFNSRGDSLVVKSEPLRDKIPASKLQKIDLQFFPEGGDLINGLRSKIAFKAINQDGLSEDVKGTIIDNSGNEVAAFNTQHLGMGAFPLEPQKGKQYVAKVTAANGDAFTTQLPVAKDEGFTLSINNNLGDSLYVKVAAQGVRDTAFYLIAQCDGKYYFAAACKVKNEAFSANIPKSRFPTGVVQFTLFSQNGEPLNERIVFIQSNDQVNLTLTTDKQVYALGEKVKLIIEAKDRNGNPAAGTFSISVIDESKVPVNEEAENTIFTDLLLKSEIAGYIEKPNYYFIAPNDKTKADLDLLMLTQGYRRFEWKRILDDKTPKASYQPESLLSVAGTVKTLEGKLVPNAKVSLASFRQMLATDTVADVNGNFRFDNLFITDTTKLYLRPEKANKEKIEIKKPDYPIINKVERSGEGVILPVLRPEVVADMKKQFEEYSGNMKKGITLKQVDIKADKNPLHLTQLKHSDNLNGAGQANQVIMGDQLKGCTNLADCLGSLLRGGVRLDYPGPIIYSTHTTLALNGGTKPMAVLLDGVITDQSVLKSVSPTDIYSIEALESHVYTAIYGSAATGGLLVITTRRGDEAGSRVAVQPGLTIYTIKGFEKVPQFYSPQYRVKTKTDRPKSQSMTLYWKPAVSLDNEGKSSIDFYNISTTGKVSAVIEGITATGSIGRITCTYKSQ